MILSGSAVQTKGLDRGLQVDGAPEDAARLRRRLVRMAKKPSMALSQLAEVGVKWKVHRG